MYARPQPNPNPADDLVGAVFQHLQRRLDQPASLLALRDPRAKLSHLFNFDYLACTNIVKLKQLSHLALKEIELLAGSRTLAENPIFNLYEEFAEHANQRFIALKARNAELSALSKAYRQRIKRFKLVTEKIKEAAALRPSKDPDFNCKPISPQIVQGAGAGG